MGRYADNESLPEPISDGSRCTSQGSSRVSLKHPDIGTLSDMRDMLAAHGFSDAELSELVDPQLGIITGFADLLEQLEVLRKMDLGATPPVLGPMPPKDAT